MDFLYREGDHVVLLDSFEKSVDRIEQGLPSVSWTTNMFAFIGKEGIVQNQIDEHGRPVYRINFYEDPLTEENLIDFWYVEEDWIEPAKCLEIDTSEIDSFLSEFGGDHNV